MSIIKCQYLEEPLIQFADQNKHIDPKLGISRYGPKSYSPKRKHPDTIRIGFIGSAESIDKSYQWMIDTAKGVQCDEDHVEFPGFMEDRGFFSQMIFDADWNAQFTQKEIEDLIEEKRAKDRFEALLQILEDKISAWFKNTRN